MLSEESRGEELGRRFIRHHASYADAANIKHAHDAFHNCGMTLNEGFESLRKYLDATEALMPVIVVLQFFDSLKERWNPFEFSTKSGLDESATPRMAVAFLNGCIKEIAACDALARKPPNLPSQITAYSNRKLLCQMHENN